MDPMWISAGVGAAGAGAFAWAVRGRSSSVFGESVYRGSSGRRSIALTFDDGPSESTPELLAILEKHKVKATFFMCGANVERCPDVARQVRDMGHEIGNHTQTHARFDFESGKFIYEEDAGAQTTILAATGVTPVWFRAPYGVRWFGVRSAQRRLALRGAMWTLIGRDWSLPGELVAERVLEGAGPGAIVCLHDGRELQAAPDIRATTAAVELVLPRLINQGYEFETMTEINADFQNAYSLSTNGTTSTKEHQK